MTTKICTKCKQDLPLTEYFHRSSSTKLRSECKKCSKQTPDIVCPVCGVIHTRHNTNRKSIVCSNCYPKYRYAYSLYHSCLHRANKLKLDFDLTIEWIHEQLQQVCPKTGFTYTFNNVGRNFKTRHPHSPSVDKIDPNAGYTKENCQVVCWWYNVTKQQFSGEEVLELCKAIVAVSSKTPPALNVENMDQIEKEIT